MKKTIEQQIATVIERALQSGITSRLYFERNSDKHWHLHCMSLDNEARFSIDGDEPTNYKIKHYSNLEEVLNAVFAIQVIQ